MRERQKKRERSSEPARVVLQQVSDIPDPTSPQGDRVPGAGSYQHRLCDREIGGCLQTLFSSLPGSEVILLKWTPGVPDSARKCRAVQEGRARFSADKVWRGGLGQCLEENDYATIVLPWIYEAILESKQKCSRWEEFENTFWTF